MNEIKIKITTNGVTVIATLNDSPTACSLWDALPIEAQAQTWGDEIYFSTPVSAKLDEWARETVDMGDIGYWPPGSALCLFFGPTPASRSGEIRPASAVNLLGNIDGDPKILKNVKNGAKISVERVE